MNERCINICLIYMNIFQLISDYFWSHMQRQNNLVTISLIILDLCFYVTLNFTLVCLKYYWKGSFNYIEYMEFTSTFFQLNKLQIRSTKLIFGHNMSHTLTLVLSFSLYLYLFISFSLSFSILLYIRLWMKTFVCVYFILL